MQDPVNVVTEPSRDGFVDTDQLDVEPFFWVGSDSLNYYEISFRFEDMELSDANLPPGTRLDIGSAVIEVTSQPHLGCRKFAERFGRDAFEFVNSELGRRLNLRGINAKVVQGGSVRIGQEIRKLG